MGSVDTTPQVEWGTAHHVSPGQKESGDLAVALPHRRGLLLAVIDGCGHGPEAARVAQAAADCLREQPDDSVLGQVHRCHAALAGTRGVVMTLADYDATESALTLCGIGNVEAVLFRARAERGAPARETALLRGGIVGGERPAPYASVVPVHGGDVLVMLTDGVRAEFAPDLALRQPPQRLAEQLLARNSKGNDDALVLVARFPASADE
jgi:negative regulator of sigma-B (phosphoserine phosphatase)